MSQLTQPIAAFKEDHDQSIKKWHGYTGKSDYTARYGNIKVDLHVYLEQITFTIIDGCNLVKFRYDLYMNQITLLEYQGHIDDLIALINNVSQHWEYIIEIRLA